MNRLVEEILCKISVKILYKIKQFSLQKVPAQLSLKAMNALEISVDDGLMLLCSSLTWAILVACDLLCLKQHVQSRSNLSWHLCLSSLVVAGLHCRCKQFL